MEHPLDNPSIIGVAICQIIDALARALIKSGNLDPDAFLSELDLAADHIREKRGGDDVVLIIDGFAHSLRKPTT